MLVSTSVCAQLCPSLCGPMGCSPPGSFPQGIIQARILEWGSISYFRGSFSPRDWTCSSCVSCFGRQILYHLMPLGKPSYRFNKSILVQWFKTIETSFTVCRLKVQSESYGAKAKHRETRRESVSLSFPACRAAFHGWGPLHLQSQWDSIFWLCFP